MNNIKNKKITYFCGLASSLLSPSFSSMNKVTELPPLHQFPSIAKKQKQKRHCWAHVCDKHKCTHALSKYGCKYAARCQPPPPPPQFHNWEQRLRTIYELTLQTASTTHCRQAHMERYKDWSLTPSHANPWRQKFVLTPANLNAVESNFWLPSHEFNITYEMQRPILSQHMSTDYLKARQWGNWPKNTVTEALCRHGIHRHGWLHQSVKITKRAIFAVPFQTWVWPHSLTFNSLCCCHCLWVWACVCVAAVNTQGHLTHRLQGKGLSFGYRSSGVMLISKCSNTHR